MGKHRTYSLFAKAAVLMSGTAIAQAMSMAAAPILARLYSPGEFGVLGVFSALVLVGSVVAGGRYELAIVLPKDDEEAANIMALACVIVALTAALATALAVGCGGWLASILRSPGLAERLWLLPVSIASVGLYQVFNYWSTRFRRFERLSCSRVSLSVAMLGAQISGRVAGLTGGQVLGQSLATVVLGAQIWRDDFARIRAAVSCSRLGEVARRYAGFPLYNGPTAVINAVSQTTPPLLFSVLFGPAVVGSYWLSYRLVLMPQALIGESVRQVFFERASGLNNAGQDVYALLRSTTLTLAAIIGLPAAVVIAFGPDLFAFAFGDAWLTAGVYARWMMVWWCFQFINPPSVMLMLIYNLQRQHMLLESVAMAARFGCILAGFYLESPTAAVALFSLAGAATNLVLVAYVFRVASRRRAPELADGGPPRGHHGGRHAELPDTSSLWRQVPQMRRLFLDHCPASLRAWLYGMKRSALGRLSGTAEEGLFARIGRPRAVLQGPFAGMEYGRHRFGTWLPKLLGTYEMELRPAVEEICRLRPDTIINIGAADGYYAVGLALRNPLTTVVAFEACNLERGLLRRTAGRNRVGDTLIVRGLCTPENLREALHGSTRPVVICDCEGFEDDLLRPDAVPGLERATILVELHDHLRERVSERIRRRFEPTHRIEEIRACPRRPSDLPAGCILPAAEAARALHEHRAAAQAKFFFLTPEAGPVTSGGRGEARGALAGRTARREAAFAQVDDPNKYVPTDHGREMRGRLPVQLRRPGN